MQSSQQHFTPRLGVGSLVVVRRLVSLHCDSDLSLCWFEGSAGAQAVAAVLPVEFARAFFRLLFGHCEKRSAQVGKQEDLPRRALSRAPINLA
jgi:hypothetical protein